MNLSFYSLGSLLLLHGMLHVCSFQNLEWITYVFLLVNCHVINLEWYDHTNMAHFAIFPSLLPSWTQPIKIILEINIFTICKQALRIFGLKQKT